MGQVQVKLDLPLASRDRPWDAVEAEGRVRRWAGGPDRENIDWNRFFRGFFWRASPDADRFGDYKLAYADVINGTLTAVPRAIFAVAAVLQGARGGVDVPEADLPRLRRVVSAWYADMRSEFDDDSIIAPWEAARKVSASSAQSRRQDLDQVVKITARGISIVRGGRS